MKRWRRYEETLLSGLWHVHTELTDGEDSAAELVDFAVENRFPLLGITEHVRRDLTYDFDALYEAAKQAASDEDLRCVVGCEAKVLDSDGTLDVSEETLARSDIVYAAYHGVPFSREEYVASIRAMLATPDVDVWAHPWSYAEEKGYTISADERAEIYRTMRENDVLFELNLRRRPMGFDPRRELRDVRPIIGYDLHGVDQWTSEAGTE